jgi:hypothetical protein
MKKYKTSTPEKIHKGGNEGVLMSKQWRDPLVDPTTRRDRKVRTWLKIQRCACMTRRGFGGQLEMDMVEVDTTGQEADG